MTERGEGFRIGVFCGAAEIPREGCTGTQALDVADRRLTQEREAQGDPQPIAMRQLMLRRLRETRGVEAGVGCTMGELARKIAEQLGLGRAATARAALAAELHESGKPRYRARSSPSFPR